MHLLPLLTALLVIENYNLPERKGEREREHVCEQAGWGGGGERHRERLISESKQHSKRAHPINGFFFMLKTESYFPI